MGRGTRVGFPAVWFCQLHTLGTAQPVLLPSVLAAIRQLDPTPARAPWQPGEGQNVRLSLVLWSQQPLMLSIH